MAQENSYQRRIVLDRYAVKDPTAKPKIGDTVVVSILRQFSRDGEEIESREIGEVVNVKNGVGPARYDVKLLTNELIEKLDRNKLEVVVETEPTDIYRRLANAIVKNEPENTEFRDAVFEALKNEEFVPAGRIQAGLGREDLNLTLFNCYVLPRPTDSRAGIAKRWGEMFEIYSRGGGIGFDVSSLRPEGAVVRKVNGRSSGAVSWMEQFSQITGAVEQGGSRRGALLMGMKVWHPDIEKFITVKSERDEWSENGVKHSRSKDLIKNANISVLLTDDFMEAVEADADWDLVFPKTDHPDYDETWDGNLRKWKEAGKPVEVYKTIRAKDLWLSVIEKAWDSGEPGLLFIDRMNKLSNSWYFAEIECTNPCVTGDTRIATDRGLIKVDDLMKEPKAPNYLVDSRFGHDPTFSEGTKFWCSGTKPVFRLETKEGFTVCATEDHKIMTPTGWKQLGELEPGDKIHIANRGGAFGKEGSLELGRVLGWFVADGHFTGETAKLDFYGDKRVLAPQFVGYVQNLVGSEKNYNPQYEITGTAIDSRDQITIGSTRLRAIFEDLGLTADNKYQVPESVFRGTEDMQRGFLQGLFEGDGSIQGPKKAATTVVRLTSISKSLLRETQQALLNFGIASRIYWDRRSAGWKKMPDGKGGLKRYWCQACHELEISKSNVVAFVERVGFIREDRNQAIRDRLSRYKNPPQQENFIARVEKIEPNGEAPVYDVTVYSTHSFAGNSMILANCAEQALPGSSVCNLGHLNLASFARKDVEHFPSQEVNFEKAVSAFDLDRFKSAVRTGIKFLDNIIDLEKYFFDSVRSRQLSERRIGLGILGYGELLVRLGLRYGSEDAIEFTNWLFRQFAEASYSKSIELAKEKGPFPEFDAEKFLQSGFVKALPKYLKDQIGKHGMRNVTCNTVAPTGSVGTALGTTTGIEPYFSWEWLARSRIGEAAEKANVLGQVEEKFGEDRSSWPSYFVTVNEIRPSEHVATQSAAQRWIDSSISKTVNLPNSATVEDVSEAYWEMYRGGCKGGTVYRDGSRDRQVLYFANENEDDEEFETLATSVEGTLRPKIKFGYGPILSQETPVGSVHLGIRARPEKLDEPYDLFIVSGKGDVGADVQAMARLISVILRWPDNASVSQKRRLAWIRDQLRNIPGRSQVGFGPEAVKSLPDAIAKIIGEYLSGKFTMEAPPPSESKVRTASISESFDFCPDCGSTSLLVVPGKCSDCKNCGYSACG